MKFYTAIKNIADDRGVSIHKLETKLGLGNGSISQWDKHEPRVSSVYKVSKFLGVDIFKLAKRAEEVANETADDR